MHKNCIFLLALIQLSTPWISCQAQGINMGFMPIPDIGLTPKFLNQNAPLIVGDLDFFMQKINLDNIANIILNQEERAREIEQELNQRETNFKIAPNINEPPIPQEQNIHELILEFIELSNKVCSYSEQQRLDAIAKYTNNMGKITLEDNYDNTPDVLSNTTSLTPKKNENLLGYHIPGIWNIPGNENEKNKEHPSKREEESQQEDQEQSETPTAEQKVILEEIRKAFSGDGCLVDWQRGNDIYLICDDKVTTLKEFLVNLRNQKSSILSTMTLEELLEIWA